MTNMEPEREAGTGGARKPAPREIELKLGVNPADMDDLRAHASVAAIQDGPPVRQQLTTTYYDTPELALSRRGIALRVRRAGERVVQSVKGLEVDGDSPALVAARSEYEWPIAGDWPEMEPLRRSGLTHLIGEQDFKALRPMFASEIDRTAIPVRFDAETTAEIAFDVGRVKAGSAHREIAEIELELKSGAVGQLFALASELHRAAPVRIVTQGKAQLGFALVSGLPPAPHKAATVEIEKWSTAAEAFLVIARGCVGHLLANEPSALSQFEPEKGIHQMRVAARRLRSALLVFRDLLAEDDYHWAGGELKWLAGELGAARDWDVFVGVTLANADGRARLKPAADALALYAGEAQMESRERAAGAIRSPRYASFLLRFAAWLETGPWRAELDDDARVMLDRRLIELAPQWLDRRRRKVRKAGRRIAQRSPEQRHEFRKELKKLRYTAEFLSSLYPRKRTARYLAAISKLQDVLGEMNDAAVARELLDRLEQGAGPAIQEPVAQLSAWLDKRARKQVEKLPRRCTALSGAAPFWE